MTNRKTDNVVERAVSTALHGKDLSGDYSGKWGHLIRVIDTVAYNVKTASDACIVELITMVDDLGVTDVLAADMLASVKVWEGFQRKIRDWQTARMEAFGKHLSSKRMAIHAAMLDFVPRNDGKAVCDCETIVVIDEGEMKYSAQYSRLYRSIATAFWAAVKDDPVTAFAALRSDNAAAEIRRLYQAILESRTDGDESGSGKTGDNASGEEEVFKMPSDSPDWLLDLSAKCESLKKLGFVAYESDPEKAAKIIPEIARTVHALVRELAAEFSESSDGDNETDSEAEAA